jgi:hypothetical protein
MAAEASPDEQDTVGATCFYAIYDPATRRCAMAGAGHPPPIVLNPDGTFRIVDLPAGPLADWRLTMSESLQVFGGAERAGPALLYLEVPDLDETMARLKQRGLNTEPVHTGRTGGLDP